MTNPDSPDTLAVAERTIVTLGDYGVRNALVLGRYRYNSAREKLDDHCHEGMIEICYCHKGNQTYLVNDNVYAIKGGDVFVTFPGEIHSTGTHPEEKGVLYWMQISVDTNGSFFGYNEKDNRSFIHSLLNLPNRHFKGSAHMRETLVSIMEVTAQPADSLQKIILENLIVSFLLQTIKAASNFHQVKSLASENSIKIERFISSNYKEALSVKIMADMLHLSESRFKSWFKQEFGIPPLEFVLRKRIEEAKNVMQSASTKNISNLAYDLGFSSPQHFATIFKRYTLLTPKQFKYHGTE